MVEVVSSDFLQAKAIDQWTRELPVKAVRGAIYSADGKLLAGDTPSYAVYVRTRCVTDSEKVSSALNDLFGVDKAELKEKIDKKASSEITVARKVSKELLLSLNERELDGVYYSVDGARYYPYDEVLCQVLGYTSVDGTGSSGLEKYYDKYLTGENGKILYESDLVGHDIEGKTPSYIEAQDGLDIVLTVDLGIQLVCESVLDNVCETYSPKSCSTVVLDVNSGKVLAMAVKPSFNLNEIPRDDVATLNKLSRNGIAVDSYEPGSTFKIVTALADIEETLKGNKNAKPLNYVFNSSRYRLVGGGKIKCWSSHANGKHSNQTLSEALNNSCNPCFADIALSLGKEKFYEYVTALNFGSPTGIDYGGEASGMVIPCGAVTDGDLARISFGQSIAVTPLQLAAAAACSVNGGKYYSPYLVSEIRTKDGVTVENILPKLKTKVASEQASKILAGYLERVVKEGSGKQAYIEGYKVGGKTGTAQKYENGVIAQGKYVMSFMGFFPADSPKYLCLLTVDEPIGGQYGSTVAAPMVKEILKGIINAKNIQPYE